MQLWGFYVLLLLYMSLDDRRRLHSFTVATVPVPDKYKVGFAENVVDGSLYLLFTSYLFNFREDVLALSTIQGFTAQSWSSSVVSVPDELMDMD